MTILIWRFLSLAFAALFLAGILALIFTRLLRNRYFHEFKQDELVRSYKAVNTKNSIYLTSGETAKFIKRYVICKTAYDKYVVCNFTKKFSNISFFVVEYNSRKRVIGVKKIEQYNTQESSKVVAVSSRCVYVNVVVCSADGAQLNGNVIRPLSLAKIRLYAFLKSFVIFAGLFVVRHFIVELLGGIYMKFYLSDLMNYIAVGASFLLCVLNYFITVRCFRRKNIKTANGGALEYEFV